MSPRLRRRVRPADQSGAAILEFALVIPLFLFMLYGIVTFGVILAQKQQVTNAASDGARAAVGSADLAAAKAAATTRIQNSLGPASPVGPYRITFNDVPGDPDYDSTLQTSGPCGSANCITVRITYDYKNHPIVPVMELPALHLGVPDKFRSTAVVQYS